MNHKHTKEENQARVIERLRNQICINAQSYAADLCEKNEIINQQNHFISELKDYTQRQQKDKEFLQNSSNLYLSWYNKELKKNLNYSNEMNEVKYIQPYQEIISDKPIEQMTDEEINRLIEEKRKKE
jgi:hypothetical protein